MPDGRTIRTVLRQTRYQTLVFMRTPRAMVFTLFFPLFFLFMFNSLNGKATITIPSGTFRYAQVFTPGISVFGLLSACYTGLAMSVVMARDALILKRIRGTPLQPWIYMAGRIASMSAIAIGSVVLMILFGVVFYGVRIIGHTLAATVVTVVLSCAAFSALGLAVTRLASTSEGAPAVVNFTLFPILFISDIFFRLDTAPAWLRALGWAFPIKHAARLMQDQFTPVRNGSGFEWTHLGALALWLVIGMLLALRTFRWEPVLREGGRRRRQRARAAAAA